MESELNFYKRECGRLQRKLVENEEIIKRMMYTNAELMEKLDAGKSHNAKLKVENVSLNSVIQKLLLGSGAKSIDELKNAPTVSSSPKKPKGSEVTASGYLVFGDPIKKLQDSSKRNLDDREVSGLLQASQEYLQLYANKNSALAQEVHERRTTARELQKENEHLRRQCGRIEAVESAAERQAQLDERVKRVRMRQLIFHSFTYLGVEDLMSVSLVCVAFYAKCSELFLDAEYWKKTCAGGFTVPRDRLWVRYMCWQRPQHPGSPAKKSSAISVKPKFTGTKTSRRKDSTEVPEEDEAKAETVKESTPKPGEKNGFFDCSYAFFESAEPAPGEPSAAGLVDYSLMNAEFARCDPSEVLSPEFMAHFGFVAAQSIGEESAAGKDAEAVERIMARLQQTHGLKLSGQGIAIIVCYLYVVLKRNEHSVFRTVGALLDAPYHLRKLYAEDYYLLNLVIFQIDYLMRQKIPDLHFHLKDENIMLHDFLVEWVLTLLSYEVRFELR